ncbi:MAG: hypothetical protein ACYDC2_11895 [Solirubrobacteraceae bacterium]
MSMFAALAVGVAAGLLAQEHSPALFGALLAAIATVLAGYVALAKRRQSQLRRVAILAGAAGCLACVAGLLRLGHAGLDVALGVAVGALLHTVLVFVVLIL